MSITMNIKRAGVLALSLLFAASIYVAAMPSQMVMGVRPPSDNITICHRTNSAVNPYNEITVDPNSLFRQGHDGHTGDVFDSSVHNQQNRTWGDIIPPFDYEGGSYPGLNWTEAGRTILDNGCSIGDNGTHPTIDISVRPIFECFAEVENGYMAYFGYLNQSTIDGAPYEAYIPIGDANKFSPQPIDRGQPEFFEPGRTDYVNNGGVFMPENAAVAIAFDGSNLVWTLDGRTSTASVNNETLRCPEPAEEYFFQFDKEWEGDVNEIDLDAIEVSFVADDEFEWTLGVDAAVPVVPGETRLTNVREVVTGLPEQCSLVETTSPAGDFPLTELDVPVPSEDIVYDEDNTLTLTVTNTVECDEPADEGDVLGEDDEKKDEGEILAATTVRSLPETGSSAGIIASVAAVIATSLAMASTVARSAFVRFTA